MVSWSRHGLICSGIVHLICYLLHMQFAIAHGCMTPHALYGTYALHAGPQLKRWYMAAAKAPMLLASNGHCTAAATLLSCMELLAPYLAQVQQVRHVSQVFTEMRLRADAMGLWLRLEA